MNVANMEVRAECRRGARVTEERLKETSGSLYGRTQGSLISLSKHFASGLKLTEVTNQTER